jgi:phosphonate transport system ATP-binding protein
VLLNTQCIVAENVSKVFGGGHHALHEFSCGIAAGERIALVGANGAGKSTALKLLNLSYRPSGGRIVWNGLETGTLNAESLRRLRSRIGTVPQKYDLIPQLTVRANVLTGRLGRYRLFESFWTMMSGRDTREVQHALELVGIPHLIEERCDRLSGGEQQRVAIARALFQDPSVLFADEPLAAVDPAGATKLMELLVSVCEASGCALIMTSHQLHLLRDYFPRIIGLRQGRTFFDVKSKDLSPRMLSALYGTDGTRKSVSSPGLRATSVRKHSLRIGISSAGCEFLAGTLLPEIADVQPDASLSVCTGDDPTLARQIDAGELDLAFVLKGEATEEIGLIPVREEKIVLVSSTPPSGAPLSTDELAELTLLWPYRAHPVSQRVAKVLEQTKSSVVRGSPTIELGSIHSVKAAAMRGLGAAFVPRALVATELQEGLLHELTVVGVEASYPIFAMRRQGHRSTELIDTVVDLAARGRNRAAAWYG